MKKPIGLLVALTITCLSGIANANGFCDEFKGKGRDKDRDDKYSLCHEYCEVKLCHDDNLRKGGRAHCRSVREKFVNKCHKPPSCEPYTTSIKVTKTTNGTTYDPAVPLLLVVGQPVTWTYVVTNTGNTPVTLTSVSDEQTGMATPTVVTNCTQALPASLAVGATNTCTLTGSAVAGSYTNTVTATANYGATTVTSKAIGGYEGLTPGIALTKDNGGVGTIGRGSQFTWNVSLTNTGGFPLTITSLTDTDAGNGNTPTEFICDGIGANSTLLPGASVSCTETATAPDTLGPWNNSVNLSATYQDGTGASFSISSSATATTTVVAVCPDNMRSRIDTGFADMQNQGPNISYSANNSCLSSAYSFSGGNATTFFTTNGVKTVSRFNYLNVLSRVNINTLIDYTPETHAACLHYFVQKVVQIYPAADISNCP